MNKVVMVSDVHFGVSRNSELFLNSSLTFFRDQLATYLYSNNIKDLFILGDVFDNRTAINVKISDEVYTLLGDTLKDFNITILIGNHDIYYKNSNDVHSLKLLNHLDNVTVVDKIETRNVNGRDVLFCPWINDYNDTSVIEEFENSDADVLFGHFDIVGFSMNRTRVSDIGLSPEDFTNFKKVFSGHYHTPSSKRLGRTEIIYCGSPYQMDRNDLNETKGFIVLNLDTLRYKRVANDVSVKFVEVEYPDIPEREDIEGNIVDALITIEKSDLSGNIIDKYLEKLEKFNPIELNTSLNVITHENSDFELNAGNINSVKDLLEVYINNDDNIDNKEEILILINDIHDEVS